MKEFSHFKGLFIASPTEVVVVTGFILNRYVRKRRKVLLLLGLVDASGVLQHLGHASSVIVT